MRILDDLGWNSRASVYTLPTTEQAKTHECQLRHYNNALNGGQKTTQPDTPPDDLTACLQYFRSLGLTDHEIRLAITPALFEAVAKRGEK